jgi:16S rRNA (guanine527-N7)-methyltransferase
MKEKLKTLINKYSLSITDEKIDKLIDFASEVIDKNKKVNLISSKDENRIIERHIIDSLIFFKLDFIKGKNQTILDIGSGGGFPGVVIAIIDESIKITLSEKRMRKYMFLLWIREKLKLKNVDIIGKKISGNENLFFDIITQRASGKIDYIHPLAMKLLKEDGKFISWMSEDDLKGYQNQPNFIYNYYLEDGVKRSLCVWRK